MARNINERNIVRMEKKATNRFGLFLLFLVVFSGIGFGGYYLYKHRNELSFEIEIPWNKKKTETNNGIDKDGNKEPDKNISDNDTKLLTPTLLPKQYETGEAALTLTNIKADDKGYEITAKAKAIAGIDITIESEKILIDGYETSAKLIISDPVETGGDNKQQYSEATFRIPKTEMDSLDIVTFQKISIYYRVKTSISESKVFGKEFKAYNSIELDNSRKGTIEIFSNYATIANYYKYKTDKDNTYIYFDFKNLNKVNDQVIKVKKLLINGELYDYTDLNILLYRGSEQVFYLTIPKDKVKKVEDFTISFYLITKTEKSDMAAIYITPEYNQKLKS